MKMGILIGYYHKKSGARDAVSKLKREGYRRVSWIHKNAQGKINRSWFGVNKQLISDHSRWLCNDETVLILQAPLEKLHQPSSLLSKSAQVPPTVFILHPLRERSTKEVWPWQISCTTEELQEQAQRLAASHVIDPRPLRDIKLLKRLKQSRSWVQTACQDLTEANRLEQSLPPTAEWLLDNEYIFEDFVNYQADMILHAGFPDIPLSPPHSEASQRERSKI